MNKQPFPLFKGATRVATYGGVPMAPLVKMVMAVGCIALIVSLWAWLLAPMLWFIMLQITKNDDKAFRIWGLYIETKFRNKNKGFWKASSYSPINNQKRRG